MTSINEQIPTQKIRAGQVWHSWESTISLIIEHHDCSFIRLREVILYAPWQVSNFNYGLSSNISYSEIEEWMLDKGKGILLANNLVEFHKKLPSLLVDPNDKIRSTVTHYVQGGKSNYTQGKKL